jgi:hypothetical protein
LNQFVFLIFGQNRMSAHSGWVSFCSFPGHGGESLRVTDCNLIDVRELFFTDVDPAFVGQETFEKNELRIPVSNRLELRIMDEVSDIPCGHSCGLEFR